MKKFLKPGIIAAITSVLFTSCLKDTAVTDYTENGIKPIVLIPNGNFPSTVSAPIKTFEVTTVPQEIKLIARVSWSKPLGKPLTVTFTKNTALIAQYNTAFGTNYAELNQTAYSIPSLSVTIPADQTEAYIPISIFTDKVNLAQENMLAFSISDASGEEVASNFKNIVIPIGVKNKYDGVYSLKMRHDGWAAFGIADGVSLLYPGAGIGLVTAGANSVSFYNYLRGDVLMPGFSVSGNPPVYAATAFGAATPRITFNTTTNAVTDAVNTTPDDGRGRFIKMNPAVTTSRYDPATKTVYLSVILTQNGRPDLVFYDTLVYKGPR